MVTFAFLLLIFVTTVELLKTMPFKRLNGEKLSLVLSQMLAFLCHCNLAEEWGCGFVTQPLSKSDGSVLWTSATVAHSVPVSSCAGVSPSLECVHTEEITPRRINSYLYPQNMLLICRRGTACS